MKDRYFRGFTGILYDPKTKLAHFIDNPEFDKNSIVDRDNLVQRIGESYAQVPFGDLEEGAVPWKQVAKHPYFIAWAHGQEGSEKLADLASRHSAKEAYVWIPSVESLTQPEARIAALGSGYRGGRLDVSAGDRGDYGGGYAFGVRPSVSTEGANARAK